MLHKTTQRRTPVCTVYQSQRQPYGSLRVNRLVIDQTMAPGVVDRDGWGDYFLAQFDSPVIVDDRDGRHVLDKGGFICWSTGARNYYGHHTQPWLHTCMHVEGPAADGMLDGFPCDTVFAPVDGVMLRSYFEAINREVSVRASPDEVIVRNLVECLVRSVKRQVVDDSHATAIPTEYIALREYIRQHYDEKLCVADLASRIGISPSLLFREYRRYFGTSPIAERIRAQMEQARYLMSSRSFTLSQIALRVGFESLPYFSRMARKYFGKSARAVRAELFGAGSATRHL